MMTHSGLALAALVLIGGCTAHETSAPEPASSEASAAVEALPTRELMAHVVDAAAQAVWARQGSEITVEGERELFPTTDAAWLEAENASATVAATASLLLDEARAQPGEAWTRSAEALRTAGLDAFRAAEARNNQAFFDAGGRIYAACLACHEQYLPSAAGAQAAPASNSASPR